ncbi:glycosyltransferase [Intestinibacter sp.]
MKKKVLFVITTLYNGGAEKSLVSLLQTMDPEKYDIDLILFKKMGMFLEYVPEYVNILDVPKEMETLYGFEGNNVKKSVFLNFARLFSTGVSKLSSKSYVGQRQFRWKYFYKKIIKEQEKYYDTAVAYIEGEPIYYIVDKIKAKRKVAWIHNDYNSLGCSPQFDRKYLGKLDGIVSVSNQCVDILKEVFPEYEEKISYIPNLTCSKNIKNMAQEFYPEEYKNNENKTIILSIGRLNEQKGFDLAIEAASYLSQWNYSFKWIIVGDGALENKLRAMIKSKNLESKVSLIGARKNPYPYIKNCDIFAQPSRFEGKSIALDEAKILQKPILITNYSTAKDQIKQGQEGIIVDMNPKGIAEGIKSMIDDKKQAEKLSAYLSKFEYGNEKEVDLYYKIIG